MLQCGVHCGQTCALAEKSTSSFHSTHCPSVLYLFTSVSSTWNCISLVAYWELGWDGGRGGGVGGAVRGQEVTSPSNPRTPLLVRFLVDHTRCILKQQGQREEDGRGMWIFFHRCYVFCGKSLTNLAISMQRPSAGRRHSQVLSVLI